jgi:hypothetical protein
MQTNTREGHKKSQEMQDFIEEDESSFDSDESYQEGEDTKVE